MLSFIVSKMHFYRKIHKKVCTAEMRKKAASNIKESFMGEKTFYIKIKKNGLSMLSFYCDIKKCIFTENST